MIVVIGGIVLGSMVVAYVGLAVFERFARPGLLTAWQRRSMPFLRFFAGFVPGWAVLETIGRRTGRPRRIPIGGSVRGDQFWFLVGNPSRAMYLKNIEADAHVRVRVRGRWLTGTAHPLPDDDVRKRLLRISPVNSFYLLLACRERQTVRVDLDRPGTTST